MKRRTRSISGAVLMLAIVPAIIGLLACMPVPIGNPERSRVDPDISGVWAMLGDGDEAFYIFEPYDKRTWLLTGVPIEEGSEADLSDYSLDSYEDLVALMKNAPVGDDGVTATSVVMYKAWRTRLGGAWFMTWEPKGLIGEDDFNPEYWMVLKFTKPDADTINLHLVNGEAGVFEDVAKTRRAYERVLKKNLDNKDVISEEPLRLFRLQKEYLPFAEKLAGQVIDVD